MHHTHSLTHSLTLSHHNIRYGCSTPQELDTSPTLVHPWPAVRPSHFTEAHLGKFKLSATLLFFPWVAGPAVLRATFTLRAWLMGTSASCCSHADARQRRNLFAQVRWVPPLLPSFLRCSARKWVAYSDSRPTPPDLDNGSCRSPRPPYLRPTL